MDGSEASTVAGGHVLVEGVDGLDSGHLSVLLVHVVGSGAGVVTDPDTEVLDLEWSLLVDLIPELTSRSIHSFPAGKNPPYLVEGDDLASTLLNSSELLQEVPESGLCDNVVWSKYPHAVELWGLVGLAGELAPNDLVFVEAAHSISQKQNFVSPFEFFFVHFEISQQLG